MGDSDHADLFEAFRVLSPRDKLAYATAMLSRRLLTVCLESEHWTFPAFPLTEPLTSGCYPASELGSYLRKFDALSSLQVADLLSHVLEEVPLSIVVGVSSPCDDIRVRSRRYCFPAVPSSSILQAISRHYQEGRQEELSQSLSAVSGLAEEELLASLDDRTKSACLVTILKSLPLVASICDGDTIYKIFPIKSDTNRELPSAAHGFLRLVSKLPAPFKINCLFSIFNQVSLAIVVGAFADDSEDVEPGEFQVHPGRRAGCYIFPSLPADDVFRAITNAHKAAKPPTSIG